MAVKPFSFLKDFSLILLSSLLLVLSFPNFNLGLLVWISLVPLLVAINGRSLGYSFLFSFVCGMLFFIGIFHWIPDIPNYTFLHLGILVIYLGSYFGFFGFIFNFISRNWGITPALFATPFILVSLEYARSNLSFWGPWALLAHSQYQYPLIIQIASFSGMYGVSFLIALVNSALVAMVYPLFFRNTSVKPSFLNLPSRKGKIAIASAAMLLTAFSAIHGYVTMSKPIAGKSLRISAIQPNIEQTKKWDPAYAREIMQILADLTRKASKDQPALIIWPEAAIPGAINQNVGLHFEVRNIAKNAGAHLLLGSVQNRKFVEKGAKEVKSFNSAFLIDPQPTTYKNHRYNKIRLFPFGEYLPLKGIMPWSYINLGNTNESIPGKEFTVFELHNSHFGAMICWETVFPELVRQFVRRGAQFMVNISNEAHFAEAATHYQFVSSSVFRAVENRVFVIRCANAGVSCIIDPNGRIVKKVKDATGRDIFVRGVMSGWIVPLESKTIYTRYGDLLVFLAFVVSAVFLFAALLHNR